MEQGAGMRECGDEGSMVLGAPSPHSGCCQRRSWAGRGRGACCRVQARPSR